MFSSQLAIVCRDNFSPWRPKSCSRRYSGGQTPEKGKSVTVLSFIGIDIEIVRQQVTLSGLVVGEVTQRASDEPYSTVIEQSINAETVTMINRVLERVPSKESHLLPYSVMLTFPDSMPGQWFYIAIQEAANSHTYERAVTEKNGDEQWTALRANRDWTLLEK